MEMEMNSKFKSQKSKLGKPKVKFLYDLRRVVYDQKWLKKQKNAKLYYIWRGVEEKNGLRYDITVIPPKMLGEEFVKTQGHYHFGNFAELYTILKGKVIFLIQKEKNGKIEDVYYVRAKKGDNVLVPRGYGHTMINPFSQIVKTANWVSKKCKNDYGRIERKRGFSYYYTKSGWIKNKIYKKIPKLRLEKPLKSIKNIFSKLYEHNS